MLNITFRTPESKIVKIDVDPASTITAIKEIVAKEINCDKPKEIKLIFKAKLLKDDVKIDSLNIKERDFILVHAPVNKSKKSEESENNAFTLPDVDPLPDSASALVPHLTEIPQPDFPIEEEPESAIDAENIEPEDAIDNSLLIMRHALTINHQSLANFVDAIGEPQIKENPEQFLQSIGLNPAEFDCEGVKNGTSQPLDLTSFGMLLARTCIELNIDPMEMMSIGSRLSSEEAFPPEDTQTSSEQLPPATDSNLQEEAGDALSQFSSKEQHDIKELQELGNFPLNVVIQCYKACDKNEEMAADLLFQM